MTNDFAPKRRRKIDDEQTVPSSSERRNSNAPLGAALDLGESIAQTRLSVGPAHDPYEREADDVADRVVRSLESGAPEVTGADTGPQRRVQRSATIGADGGEVDTDTHEAIQSSRGGGSALPDATRSSMESAFGTDLGHVRVHTGPQSADLNERIQAKAFTVGSDIYFRDGMPDTSSRDGQHLLAHELTHTVQQGATAQRSMADDDQIQRMPGPAVVEARAGKKSKKGIKLFGKQRGATNTYNAMLAAVKAHTDWVMRTPIGANSSMIMGEIKQMNVLLDGIERTATAYKKKEEEKGDKERNPTAHAEASRLLAMIPAERNVIRDLGATWSTKETSIAGRPKWGMLIPRDPRTYQPTKADMRPGQVAAKPGAKGGKGNNKAVDQVTLNGEDGFFADDSFSGDYSDKSLYDNAQWLLGNYGEKRADLELGNRSIAMSRLDSLLGGGVTARTVRAFNGTREGTFQAQADGKQAVDVLSATDLSGSPELARMLSRLQLLDAIAGQVDRHAKNYFIQIDKRSGKVSGITGIDLDMSWMPEQGEGRFEVDPEMGSVFGADKSKGAKSARVDHFPGFSKYVDKELADRILKLKPNDLRAILIDLLHPSLIEAAVKRLVALQNQLKRESTHLLTASQWDKAIPAILKENTGYFARDGSASGDKSKERSKKA